MVMVPSRVMAIAVAAMVVTAITVAAVRVIAKPRVHITDSQHMGIATVEAPVPSMKLSGCCGW